MAPPAQTSGAVTRSSLTLIDGEIRLDFGAAGNAARYCLAGWSTPEAYETWSVGQQSTLILPAPTRPGAHILVLELRPHVEPERLDKQRLRIHANGVPVADFTIARRSVRACIIPRTALMGHPRLELVFETPDAARPADRADRRTLAVAFSSLRLYADPVDPGAADAFVDSDEPVKVDIGAVMRADQMPLSQLMHQFESLGQNCEFGLVQRRCQAEPLGLLRFASVPLPNLLAALDAGFTGMGEPKSVRVEMSSNGREFMVTDTLYDIVYHAWVDAGAMTADELHQREVRRVPLLVRKLLEDLVAGQKIFVFKGMGALAEEVVYPLAAALRRYGPNTLLFVNLADAEHKSGLVKSKAPGFLVGYLDRFAPGQDAHDLALAQWVSVCRGAYRLVQAVKPPRPP
jgi:hypothetical protein